MNLPEFRDITSASRQVATYSAMNPILWKTVICSPIAMICSVIAPSPLSYFLFFLSALPIVVGSIGFLYFMRTDPNRLQSEGHLQHMNVLSRIGDNETMKQVVLDSISQRAISKNSAEVKND